MNPKIISTIFNMLGVLAIVIIIALMWFIIWTAIRYVIKIRDDILKERDAARIELLEIQAAKSIEWDKYKEVSDERDKLRKAYFGEKETVEKLKEEKAKLLVEKENLSNFNKELKKTNQTKN